MKVKSDINLKILQNKLRDILTVDIRKILMQARRHGHNVLQEKSDGDSATLADVQISKLLIKNLQSLIGESIVIEEESFNKSVFQKIKKVDYLWVVDPIDGTKAFRTKGNNEYCVAIALLYKGKPILSSVYAPEYKVNGQKGCLFEARSDKKGAYLNGKRIYCKKAVDRQSIQCVNHIHRDTKLNIIEGKIAALFTRQETIRAYDGHSTLVHYCVTMVDELSRVFTRREANIWDVVQAAYIIEKADGVIMGADGSKVIPVNFDKLIFQETNHKLLFPFSIACPKELKKIILTTIKL